MQINLIQLLGRLNSLGGRRGGVVGPVVSNVIANSQALSPSNTRTDTVPTSSQGKPSLPPGILPRSVQTSIEAASQIPASSTQALQRFTKQYKPSGGQGPVVNPEEPPVMDQLSGRQSTDALQTIAGLQPRVRKKDSEVEAKPKEALQPLIPEPQGVEKPPEDQESIPIAESLLPKQGQEQEPGQQQGQVTEGKDKDVGKATQGDESESRESRAARIQRMREALRERLRSARKVGAAVGSQVAAPAARKTTSAINKGGRKIASKLSGESGDTGNERAGSSGAPVPPPMPPRMSRPPEEQEESQEASSDESEGGEEAETEQTEGGDTEEPQEKSKLRQEAEKRAKSFIKKIFTRAGKALFTTAGRGIAALAASLGWPVWAVAGVILLIVILLIIAIVGIPAINSATVDTLAQANLQQNFTALVEKFSIQSPPDGKIVKKDLIGGVESVHIASALKFRSEKDAHDKYLGPDNRNTLIIKTLNIKLSISGLPAGASASYSLKNSKGPIQHNETGGVISFTPSICDGDKGCTFGGEEIDNLDITLNGANNSSVSNLGTIKACLDGSATVVIGDKERAVPSTQQCYDIDTNSGTIVATGLNATGGVGGSPLASPVGSSGGNSDVANGQYTCPFTRDFQTNLTCTNKFTTLHSAVDVQPIDVFGVKRIESKVGAPIAGKARFLFTKTASCGYGIEIVNGQNMFRVYHLKLSPDLQSKYDSNSNQPFDIPSGGYELGTYHIVPYSSDCWTGPHIHFEQYVGGKVIDPFNNIEKSCNIKMKKVLACVP